MIALDTNILIYSLQAEEPQSRDVKARALIARLAPVQPIVSLQVIGEVLNACRAKKILALDQSRVRALEFVEAFNCPPTIAEDLIRASTLSEHRNLQYFDALILTIAARAGATLLLSEDMQDGLEAAGLRVVNPFLAENAGVIEGVLGG